MPPAARKVSRPRIASSSSVSRQSAAKPGARIATLLTPLPGQLRQHPVGGGLEPFGAAEAGLEGDLQLAARAPRRAAARSCGNGNDRDRRAPASAAACRGSWRAVASGSKSSAARPAFERRFERADIGRIVMIRRQRPHRRQPAHGAADGGRPRRPRSRSSPRNIADRAARPGCARSPRAFSASSRSAIAGLP